MRHVYNGIGHISNGGSTAITRPPPAFPKQAVADMFASIGNVERMLRTQGLDWSDLATMIAGAPQQIPLPGFEIPPPTPAAEAEEKLRWIKAPALLDLIAEIERKSQTARGERSQQFLAGLRQLAADYPVVRLSMKQNRWLTGLLDDCAGTEWTRTPPAST